MRAVTESIAAVRISVFGVAGGGIRSVSSRILGLAVQILYRTCGLTGASRGLGFCVTGDIAEGALDLTGEIFCRAGNPILVHCAHSLKLILES